MTDFLAQFLLMMGVSAVPPMLYALSKAKRDFRPRTFIFNTRRRFVFAFSINFLILSLTTYEPGVLDAFGYVLSFLFQVSAKPSVYFLAAATGLVTVIGIRGDEPQGVLR
jgi:hypothetical protein